MTPACTHAEQRGAFLDGELSPPERTAFESHAAGCADCRQALDAQRALDGALRALPTIEPEPGFEARFWARVAREEQAPRGLAARLGRWLSGWRGVASGLGLAAAVATAILLAVRTSPPEVDPAAELGPDWVIVADAEQYEMLEDADLELLQVMEILEAWDGQES